MKEKLPRQELSSVFPNHWKPPEIMLQDGSSIRQIDESEGYLAVDIPRDRWGGSKVIDATFNKVNGEPMMIRFLESNYAKVYKYEGRTAHYFLSAQEKNSCKAAAEIEIDNSGRNMFVGAGPTFFNGDLREIHAPPVAINDKFQQEKQYMTNFGTQPVRLRVALWVKEPGMKIMIGKEGEGTIDNRTGLMIPSGLHLGAVSKNSFVLLNDEEGEAFAIKWGVDAGKDMNGDNIPFFVVTQTRVSDGVAREIRSPMQINENQIRASLLSYPPYPKDPETNRLSIPWMNIDKMVGASLAYSRKMP